jgi:hypothetical protein
MSDKTEITPTYSSSSASTIAACLSRLIEIINCDHSLLDEMKRKRLISHRQREDLLRKISNFDAAEQLFEYVVKMSAAQHENFLVALDEAGQQHVANYIRENGNRTAACEDNWPLADSEFLSDLENNWSQLIDIVDSRNGLLDELLSVRCINNRLKESLESKNTLSDRNELLLNSLLRKSIKDFRNFIGCLK